MITLIEFYSKGEMITKKKFEKKGKPYRIFYDYQSNTFIKICGKFYFQCAYEKNMFIKKNKMECFYLSPYKILKLFIQLYPRRNIINQDDPDFISYLPLLLNIPLKKAETVKLYLQGYAT
jgi:hypothetical protein